jgi:hypothetical protein
MRRDPDGMFTFADIMSYEIPDGFWYRVCVGQGRCYAVSMMVLDRMWFCLGKRYQEEVRSLSPLLMTRDDLFYLVYPVSAVLADRDVMLCIKPGEHGSTYGG